VHQVAGGAAASLPDFLREYLVHLEMEPVYTAAPIACEVCGCAEQTTIREQIDIGRDRTGRWPVVACDRCGFLYQNPRFERAFYEDYYSRHYRQVVCRNTEPSAAFIEDQIQRGRLLRERLSEVLPERGRLLDVGCSAGGMMIPFREAGWEVFGTDPDEGYVAYGRRVLGLPVEAVSAEAMELEAGAYDVVLIMGSLEHVYDPNRVLEICRRASAEGGLLVLEGRGRPQSASWRYFNHNHHRYFSLNSLGLMMRKHGWDPIRVTDEAICGPSRPGGIYAVGRAGAVPSREDFLALIDGGQREEPAALLAAFDRLDREMGCVTDGQADRETG